MSLLPPTTLDTGYLAAVRKLRVANAAAEVIPPHALLRVTGNDADGLLTVAKPDADSLPYLLVNGPLPIAVGATGLATFDEPVPVSYDDAHTPAAGDTWGSANGSWLLTHGKTGWRVMGSPDTESAVVEAVREGGGGSGGTIGGTVFSFLNTQPNDLAAFPAGYTRSVALSGTNLPTVTDTVRFLFSAAAPTGGRYAVVTLVPQFSLFVPQVADASYGHFVVQVRVGLGEDTYSTHNLGAVDYPAGNGSNPSHACGSPALPFFARVPGGQDYVDVTIYYAVRFYSNVAWGGAACPDIIFRACTSGVAVWSDSGPDGRSTRRLASDTTDCPAPVVVGDETPDPEPPPVHPGNSCPDICYPGLGLTYSWDNGGGDTGTATLTAEFQAIYAGVITWSVATTAPAREWVVTCGGDGVVVLTIYDDDAPPAAVFSATFVESPAGVWTGTIVDAGEGITAVSFGLSCGPGHATPTEIAAGVV